MAWHESALDSESHHCWHGSCTGCGDDMHGKSDGWKRSKNLELHLNGTFNIS